MKTSDHSREINGVLVEFENWCESNPRTDVDAFIKQHQLTPAVSDVLRQTIQLENQLNQVVAACGPKPNGHLEPDRAAATAELAGTALGNYRLIRRLGIGGMGTVWLARQENPIQRNVAIKLIRPELMTDVFVKRFETERQALATMSHPNIAKVLDAGTFDSNRPYFVMDFVNGIPITEYCNKHRYSLQQRLDLFLQCCGAIQHAHQKSILHRDIKPNNVLVCEIDGQPNVKVIDFGLSKILSDDTVDDPAITLVDSALGSPLWMSPEQAGRRRGNPEQAVVDTRSDVYSLGVILYQLLTNTTPITREFYSNATPDRVLDAIHDVTPPNPSIRIAQQQAPPDWIEEKTTSSFSSWSNMLRNDLDWVTMKALEKDRERRYSSVEALADDVRRFMNNEPVVARPVSTIYRAKKLLCKHRRAAVVIAGFTILLLASSLALVSLAFLALNERGIAEGQRSLADLERARSEQTVDFVVRSFSLLDLSNPGVEYDKFKKRFLFSIRDEINRLDFNDDPLKESSFRGALARALSGSGLHRDAIAELEQVVSVNQQLLGKVDESTISAKTRLAFEHLEIHQNTAALALAEACQADAESVFGPHHEVSIGLSVVWNRARLQQHEFDEVIANLENLVPVAGQSLGASHPYSIEALSILAEALIDKQRYSEACHFADRALQLATRRWGIEHRRSIELEVLFWNANARDSRFQKSHETMLDFLEKIDRKFGPGHLVTLGLQDEFGKFLLQKKRTRLAEQIYVDNLEACQTWLGPGHPQTVKALWGLAMTHAQLAEFETSSKLLREAIPRFAEIYGDSSKEVLNCHLYIGKNHFYGGDRGKSLEIATRYYEIASNQLGRDDFVSEEFLDLKVMSLSELGQFDLALPIFLDRWQRSRRNNGPESIQSGQMLSRLAMVHFLAGKHAESVDYYEMALEIFERQYGFAVYDTHLLLQMHANAVLHQGQYSRAFTLTNITLEQLQPELARRESFRMAALAGSANACVGLGKYAQAQRIAQQVLSMPYGPDEFVVERARAYSALAMCQLHDKEFKAAEKLLQQEMEMYESRALQKPFAWYKDQCRERFVMLYEQWEKPDMAARYRDAALPTVPNNP